MDLDYFRKLVKKRQAEINHIREQAQEGADVVELHTGSYCDASPEARERELTRIAAAATEAAARGLQVHAGHGLSYQTVAPVAALSEVSELNIGHFLMGEAIFGGLESAIRRMRAIMDTARAEASGQRSA